jgi:AcrR family transcriptional regulator
VDGYAPAVSASPAIAHRSTRRGPSEEREAARRARLLETGLEVFGTVGYARSAIESICAQARVGTHSFYRHFDSKEDLFRAVYDEVIERLGTKIVTALRREPTDLETHVGGAVTACVGHVTSDERAARVQLVEVVGISGALERHRREVMRAFARVTEREAARLHALGLTRRPVSELLAMGLIGATNELLIDWLVAPKRPSRQLLISELTHLYVAATR